MRPIHTARLDTVRPVLILTRRVVRLQLPRVTVAPITSTGRGLSTELKVGPANGLPDEGVINCDSILTIPGAALGKQIGYLLPEQEEALTAAIHAAFDLD